MRTATALTITAVGAIFAFAITAHPSFLNLQIVGWVLILTGIGGLVIPRRGRGWLRRSVLVTSSPDFDRAEQQVETFPGPVSASSNLDHAPAGSGVSSVASVDGPVERETVVEFTEK